MKASFLILWASTALAGAQVQYAFTNFAGLAPSGGAGWSDGTGSAARFAGPRGIAVDTAGNLYVTDTGNNAIRKVTPGGVVTTLAGHPGQAGSADGLGSAALFASPRGMAVDQAGNLYVGDSLNDTIRKITPSGSVSTLAGSAGQPGSTDGANSAALFENPGGVAVDPSGNVYVADSINATIRKITPDGTVSTLTGTAGQLGSADGLGGAAQFSFPRGIAVDKAGNVYVADSGNNTIRQITPDGTVSTLAGTAGQAGSTDGSAATALFSDPLGVAVDSSGTLYVADSGNQTIRKIIPNGAVTTLAGSPGQSGSTDGSGNAALFNFPSGIAVDSAGILYVSDVDNDTIRKITPSGVVTTLAGLAPQPTNGSADGAGTAARFNQPAGVALDQAGNLYLADSGNATIRKITSDGTVTTLAGTPGQTGSTDGPITGALFNVPTDVILDSAGNLYITDQGNNTIRKITPDGSVSTLAGTAGQPGSTNGTGSAALFFSPTALVVDSATNVFVTDRGNGTIRKITPDAVVSTLAGMAGQFGSTDGAGTAARFSGPTGLAIDAAGNLYVTDSNNNTIRKVTPDGVVSTLAGTAGQSGSTDGLGSAALFDNPAGLAIDSSGMLYVADRANQTIRMVSPDGMVTTIAGAAAQTGSADGLGAAARFNNPFGLAVDGSGVLYVSDQFNNRVTKGIPAFLRFETSATGLAVSQGSIQLQLTGPPTGMVVIEGSMNLQSWLPLQTNGLTAGELKLSVPLGSNQHQFFRARLTP